MAPMVMREIVTPVSSDALVLVLEQRRWIEDRCVLMTSSNCCCGGFVGGREIF